ncbi:hypothetical protein HJC23_002564 [Cyclotella cryptica]|uniref:Uncharacterized protein n=1 Tax=Cyclotella cryptica TaxID=29204 RepID=A0ABD3R3H6_9STRA|eukprot:CCRYP_001424-RB/>CCRYP_001424-RB protein AED:0.17 eAED:0.17 QI:103/0.66/0.5/1/1/1/4/0/487
MKTHGFIASHVHQPGLSSWTAPACFTGHTLTARARWNRSSVSLNAIPFTDFSSSTDSYPSISSPFSSDYSNSPLRVRTPLQESVRDWISSQPVAELKSTAASTSQLLSSSDAASPSNPDRPPTKDEISILQKAFAALYGTEQNVAQAVELLSQTMATWESTHQPGDEIAGLYRVRGDAYMELLQPKNAELDYGKAIEYLDGVDGDKADPEEKPASRLGRARAVRSMGMSASLAQAIQASNDYQTYFGYVSRLDVDEDVTTDVKPSKQKDTVDMISDAVIDGIQRNPYAAWEWGMVSRVAEQYTRAAEIHRLAAIAFEEIGDKPRATICRLDRAIDLASAFKEEGDKNNNVGKVKQIMVEAIDSTVGVDGRDVQLLQRVVAKEGEARIALSGLLWGTKEKAAAEAQFGEACGRLDELNADYESREQERIKRGVMPPAKVRRLGFSIDDIVGADEASCSRFKNEKFVEERLVWPQSLRSSVNKFLTLSR